MIKLYLIIFNNKFIFKNIIYHLFINIINII